MRKVLFRTIQEREESMSKLVVFALKLPKRKKKKNEDACTLKKAGIACCLDIRLGFSI